MITSEEISIIVFIVFVICCASFIIYQITDEIYKYFQHKRFVKELEINDACVRLQSKFVNNPFSYIYEIYVIKNKQVNTKGDTWLKVARYEMRRNENGENEYTFLSLTDINSYKLFDDGFRVNNNFRPE